MGAAATVSAIRGNQGSATQPACGCKGLFQGHPPGDYGLPGSCTRGVLSSFPGGQNGARESTLCICHAAESQLATAWPHSHVKQTSTWMYDWPKTTWQCSQQTASCGKLAGPSPKEEAPQLCYTFAGYGVATTTAGL